MRSFFNYQMKPVGPLLGQSGGQTRSNSFEDQTHFNTVGKTERLFPAKHEVPVQILFHRLYACFNNRHLFWLKQNRKLSPSKPLPLISLFLSKYSAEISHSSIISINAITFP